MQNSMVMLPFSFYPFSVNLALKSKLAVYLSNLAAVYSERLEASGLSCSDIKKIKAKHQLGNGTLLVLQSASHEE